MNTQITIEEIKNNTFFWKYYFCWSRGYDEKQEINIDEVLEVVETNETEAYEWERIFFNYEDIEDNPRHVAGRINDNLNFAVEFAEYEINFFLNDFYIGNLGGHFEAWFFTLEELLSFEKYPNLFLLFLPMTGISKDQKVILKSIVIKHLNTIPKFDAHSNYIADCLLNGLIMQSRFEEIEGIGLTNNENHSVRNVTGYPRYLEDVVKLNKILKE
ncbi:Imm19 family immunity protein [Flavobacterium humidisoli]|uniref:Imm19 family immunity protein n=1 Tax=Flavobacterium humidisoli TaxID=2937442 RepID=A0ABY4LQ46_9FLAO|nr:Imm19 family immunity protein [Flavobacterium humidisoli]UPZ14962.1 Imm19 family immunity protein [Flavobacterium humidisoli]